ncbi:MAG TPA: GNAT family protein [Microcella sp.]|nr:GNAT family protein [Microcella sp.]
MTARIPALEAIENAWVRLEPYDADAHLDGLVAALGHPDVFAGGWGGGAAAARTGAELAAWLPTYLPIDSWQVFVVRAPGGRIVGTTTALDLVARTESAHVGYTAYAPDTWGGEVNPATKLLMLERLFDHGFGRVKLQADVLNTRSRAAIERLGAQFEGIARRDQQRADGSWRDAAVYSIVVDEWPSVRAGLISRLGD